MVELTLTCPRYWQSTVAAQHASPAGRGTWPWGMWRFARPRTCTAYNSLRTRVLGVCAYVLSCTRQQSGDLGSNGLETIAWPAGPSSKSKCRVHFNSAVINVGTLWFTKAALHCTRRICGQSICNTLGATQWCQAVSIPYLHQCLSILLKEFVKRTKA